MADRPEHEVLRTRLFGYAVLYRARPRPGGGPVAAGGHTTPGYDPVPVDPEREAEALARELDLMLGQRVESGTCGPDEVGVSVPFGRCGIEGRPLEHVRLLHVTRGWLDELTPHGPRTRAVPEGEAVCVHPGRIVRFRARPRAGGRALVAFQTEDRSPLHGHAAALTLEGETVPEDATERLRVTTAAFEALQAGAAAPRLAAWFGAMARRVEADPEVAAARAAARAAGSYDAGPSTDLFAAADGLLGPGIVDRVRHGDPRLFRFPGMFGAVAPLFPVLDEL